MGRKVVRASIDNSTATVLGVGVKGEAGINWRGAWVNSVSYIAGDAVSFSGATYINVVGISAGNNEPNVTPSNWDLFSDRGAQGVQGDNSTVVGPQGLTR